MIPEIHYEISDYKNRIKDLSAENNRLKMDLDTLRTLLAIYDAGVIQTESELIAEIKNRIILNK